jgi:hypothetical protein
MHADEKLQRLFDHFQYGRRRHKQTALGAFSPISIEHLNPVLRDLVGDGTIVDSGLFSDAGCGDSRIIALMSGVYGIPSFGVECDEDLVAESRNNLDTLRQVRVIDGTYADVVCGDFSCEEVYSGAGVAFSGISTFFNYYDNPRLIADMIDTLSPRGTVFLFVSPTKAKINFSGLRFERSIKLYSENREGGDWGYLHVSRKTQDYLNKKV